MVFYVTRYPEGDIAATSRVARLGYTWEEITDDAAELLTFFETNPIPDGYDMAGSLPVPQVTNVQMRRALRIMGLFTTVDGYLRGQGVDPLALESWDYANVFLYSDPLLDPIVAALSLNKRALFALANQQ